MSEVSPTVPQVVVPAASLNNCQRLILAHPKSPHQVMEVLDRVLDYTSVAAVEASNTAALYRVCPQLSIVILTTSRVVPCLKLCGDFLLSKGISVCANRRQKSERTVAVSSIV